MSLSVLRRPACGRFPPAPCAAGVRHGSGAGGWLCIRHGFIRAATHRQPKALASEAFLRFPGLKPRSFGTASSRALIQILLKEQSRAYPYTQIHASSPGTEGFVITVSVTRAPAAVPQLKPPPRYDESVRLLVLASLLIFTAWAGIRWSSAVRPLLQSRLRRIDRRFPGRHRASSQRSGTAQSLGPDHRVSGDVPRWRARKRDGLG